MDKHGVSGVVTAVLLILLVIGAVGVLWVVIAAFVSDNSGEISGGINNVGLDIESAYIEGEEFNVKVARDGAKGDLEEVRVIFEDGGGSSKGVDVAIELREFEAKTLVVDKNSAELEGLDFGNIVKISVLPVVGEKVGKLGGEFVVGSGFVSDLDLMVYLPLDEDFEDKSGNGYGVTENNVGILTAVEGKFGGAYEIEDGKYIQVVFPQVLLDEFTLVGLWANTLNLDNQGTFISLNSIPSGTSGGGSYVGFNEDGTNDFFGYAEVQEFDGSAYFNSFGLENDRTVNLGDGSFHQVSLTYEGTNAVFYVDGVEVDTQNGDAITTQTTRIRVGTGQGSAQGSLNGIVDEIRIYNRALTPEEMGYLWKYG